MSFRSSSRKAFAVSRMPLLVRILRECQATARRTGVYSNMHEDLSTMSTPQSRKIRTNKGILSARSSFG